MSSLGNKLDDGVIQDREFRKRHRFWGLENDFLEYIFINKFSIFPVHIKNIEGITVPEIYLGAQ